MNNVTSRFFLSAAALLGLILTILPTTLHAQSQGDACSVSGKVYSIDTPGVPALYCDGANLQNFFIPKENAAMSCTAAREGALQYIAASDTWNFCNGSAWTALASGGSTAINDLTDAFTDYTTLNNLIMGRTSAAALTAGAQYNTFIGEGAGATSANSTSTTDDNTAIGYNALSALTSAHGNTAVGSQTLTAVSGDNNTAVGWQALRVNTGTSNTGIGEGALFSNTSGSNNVSMGVNALVFNTTGGNNTAIGLAALSGNLTGDNNTAIGYNTASTLTTGSSNILIGYNIDVPANNTSNYLNIGGSIYGDMSTGNLTLAGTAALTVPTGDTSQRPGSAVEGMIRYNSQTDKFEGYQASAWQDIITAGVTAASPDRGIQFNSGGSFAAESTFTYTSAGQLGLGTATPSALLHIKNIGTDTSYDALNIDADGEPSLSIETSSTSSGLNPLIFTTRSRGTRASKSVVSSNDSLLQIVTHGYNGSTDIPAAEITVEVDGTVTGGAADMPGRIEFHTQADGFGDTGLEDNVPRMVIKNDGKIGIGTTTPTYKLEIASNVEDGLVIRQAGTTDNQNPFIGMLRSKGTVAAPTLVDIDTKLMELSAYGHNGSAYNHAGIMAFVVDGTVTSGAADMPTRLEFNVQADGAGAWMGDGASVPELVIKSTGNIGIGTATPSHKLTVSGDFVDDGILIENIRNTDPDSGNLDFRRARGTSATPLVPTSGDELAHITFQGYAGGGTYTTAADIIATLDGTSSGGGDMPGQLTFRTRADGAGSTTTRMVIDNSGSVGIGVSTPPSKFVVDPPASEVIASAGTITADACGTIKEITSVGNVTTNTTNTFTAPATASYAGCCMTVINVDTADTITLDANALFKTIGGATQALGPSDAVEVCSNGTNWYQVSAVSGNQ